MIKLHSLRMICIILAMILCLVFLVPASVAAGEATEEELQLTLEEALERALRVDHSLRKARAERDKAREEKDKATDMLKDSYIYFTLEHEEDLRRVVLAELNYQMKSGQDEAARNNLETRVVEKYVSVLAAQEGVNRAQRDLALQELNYNMALIRLRNGVLPPIWVDQAFHYVKQGRSAVVQAEQDLSKAYVELNSQIGLWPEQRPQLVTEIPYQPLEIRSITTEVSRAVDASSDLFALGRYVQIQRQQLRSFFIDRDIQKIEVKLAELQEAELKSELQKQVRLFYQDILSLEEMIASTEESIKLTETALRVTQIRYDVGMAARYEVVQAEVDLASARYGLTEMQYSHVSATAAYRNLTGRTILPVDVAV